MRAIEFGNTIMVATSKRRWKAFIYHHIQGQIQYLGLILGQPYKAKEETWEDYVARCQNAIPEGKTDWPVDWRMQRKYDTGIHYGIAHATKNLLPDQKIREIGTIPPMLLLADEMYHQSNPYGIPTYAEVLAIIRRMGGVLSMIEGTIFNVRINPMKHHQQWLLDHRVKTGVLYYDGGENLWRGNIPERMMPGTGKRITIKED